MTALPRNWLIGMGISIAALVTPASVGAAPVNLVNNGDFSSGDTGFSSDYTLNTALGWDPATFTVTNDPALWHPAFVTLGDHTTGTGEMFVGNGSTVPGSTVWQSQTIDVVGGLDYYFEAFVSNVCCDNFLRSSGQSMLDFRLSFNGGPTRSLGTRATDTLSPGLWEGLSTDWMSQEAGNVTLSLVDLTSIYDANDFAIDDVYFGSETSLVPAPEPASVILLLTGLPLARAAYRRRVAKQTSQTS
jgi:hypothetical protein